MFKKTITFEDFNGETQKKDFYFHLSKPEMLRLSVQEGEDSALVRFQRIIKARNRAEILQVMEEFIAMSCGVRSEDGSQFLKTEAAKNVLLQSPAYEELLVELCTDAKAAVEFYENLLPTKMLDELKQKAEANSAEVSVVDPFADTRPAWLKENRVPTQAELMDMSAEELKMAFRHTNP